MGSVWVADHLALQTHVAIKFMASSVSDDPVSVQRFTREAKAAAQIKSPHVVQIFDHGITEDGTPYIVMELLDGESLEKRLRRLGPLNLIELTQIITQVCKALAKAHERLSQRMGVDVWQTRRREGVAEYVADGRGGCPHFARQA